ncbi:riboflavin transporter MCH5 [Thelonectria olida]|uniref:Riboflavin transporter MCH5 n=1 Tax=Thelonectria olida TaxID=1576542 RepID=A0A9P8W3U0_9HYPO|nr:riboflavin transporter MCH5 [Thelonectria olida]
MMKSQTPSWSRSTRECISFSPSRSETFDGAIEHQRSSSYETANDVTISGLSSTLTLTQDNDSTPETNEKQQGTTRSTRPASNLGDIKKSGVEQSEDGRSINPGQLELGNGTTITRIASVPIAVDIEDALPGPPPDGGLRAWCVCLAAHLVFTNTWGWVNSFGVFQTYYTTLLDRPPSDISWIGSVTVFLLFFIGTLTGRLVDAGHFRLVFAVGITFQVVGVLAVSACKQYIHFLLAQGFCVGIGTGCLFCPALAVLSTYFAKRRALAMGIAACGSVTGGLVFPSLVRQLLPKIGFAWTVRVAAFIQLGTLVVALVLVKQRIKPKRSAPLVDLSAFGELEYTFYTIGCFLSYWGVYFAFYYIASFSREALAEPLGYTQSLNLLLILNGVGVVGRLVPAWLADHIGAINVFVPNTIGACVLAFSWIAVRDSEGLYAWAVVYGPFAAAIQSLFPTGISLLTQDLSKIGVRMGMAFTIVSFSTLTGPPIAGAIIDAQGGEYWGAQVFAGVSLALGTGFMVATKVVRMRRTGTGWRAKI